MNYPLPFDCGVQRYALFQLLQIFLPLYSGNPHKYLQINRIVFKAQPLLQGTEAFAGCSLSREAGCYRARDILD